MKIKLRLFLLLFLITGLQTVLLAQQNGVLQGKITTADGQPAVSITVGLANLKKTTATNQQGEYKLTGVKPGTYTIRVTGVGLTTVEKSVTINAGEILVTDFSLNENHATTYYLLAIALTKLNRMDEAMQASLRYMQLAPDGEYAKEMKTLIMTVKLSQSNGLYFTPTPASALPASHNK